LCFELVFIIIFIVETRGRTLEETAALFDGEENPENWDRMAGDTLAISLPIRSDFQSEVYIYPGKPRAIEPYELKRPHLVLEKDRVAYKKGRVVGW
jgi:hypothetical protein